eukprot:g2509.t1
MSVRTTREISTKAVTTARETELLRKVETGNVKRVEAMLAAGASVEGPAGGPTVKNQRPLMVAVLGSKSVKMVQTLLDHGADVNAASPLELFSAEGALTLRRGVRAIHVAVIHHKPEYVRVLLAAGARLDVRYSGGITPLISSTIMRVPAERLEMARMLLDAGADPAMPDDDGRLPLHYATADESTCLADMLLTSDPTTVSHLSKGGATPLYMASGYGNEKVLSLLLSAGARQPLPSGRPYEIAKCPLDVAVSQLRFGVVRILLDKGFEAIGGSRVLPNAINIAIMGPKRQRALNMLLDAEGEARRPHLARSSFNGTPMIGWAAASCSLPALDMLLSASALETAQDLFGRVPSDIVGRDLAGHEKSPATEAAVRRMLARGPAYRARSFAWPIPGGAGGTVTVFRADGAGRRGPVHFRVHRPVGPKFFVRVSSRYAKKR